MKKIALLVLFATLVFNISAQFRVSSPNSYVLLTNKATYGVDALVLFNGISSMSEITYTGTGKVEWRYYNNTFCSNQNTISPDNATGYIVLIDDIATYHVWAVDYLEYSSTLESLDVQDEGDPCSNVTLSLIGNVPTINYVDATGAQRSLLREFTLSYLSSSYESGGWEDHLEEYTFRAPLINMTVTAPLQNCYFGLIGDQWAQLLGIATDTLESVLYDAQAVEMNLVGTIIERDGLNEKDRSETSIAGSGPLVVDFESNVNPLSMVYYEWTVWDVTAPNSYMRYTDQNLRYTFNNSGEYYVKLQVNSAACQAIDSIKVNVRESLLEVPNVFTPNGDGINDEFRVAYRSLATFRMIIYNRWGRKIYDSTDPSKGWDGKINGRDAADGTYYYLIEATGADNNSKGKPIKYKLAGDINLLR